MGAVFCPEQDVKLFGGVIAPLAQRLEHSAFNRGVAGSIPAGGFEII